MRDAKYGKKALLITSDGGDNYSRYSEKDVKSLTKESEGPLRHPKEAPRSENIRTVLQGLILVGWKSIADYLNISVRTVQRYEPCQGLGYSQAARQVQS